MNFCPRAVTTRPAHLRSDRAQRRTRGLVNVRYPVPSPVAPQRRRGRRPTSRPALPVRETQLYIFLPSHHMAWQRRRGHVLALFVQRGRRRWAPLCPSTNFTDSITLLPRRRVEWPQDRLRESPRMSNGVHVVRASRAGALPNALLAGRRSHLPAACACRLLEDVRGLPCEDGGCTGLRAGGGRAACESVPPDAVHAPRRELPLRRWAGCRAGSPPVAGGAESGERRECASVAAPCGRRSSVVARRRC